jgi:hypothetical protein
MTFSIDTFLQTSLRRHIDVVGVSQLIRREAALRK